MNPVFVSALLLKSEVPTASLRSFTRLHTQVHPVVTSQFYWYVCLGACMSAVQLVSLYMVVVSLEHESPLVPMEEKV